MTIESSAFQHNGKIPLLYTCDGEGVTPPLRVGGIPKDAQSIVLIVDDPDAPGGTFDHWVMWNIPVVASDMKGGETPQGVVGENSLAQNNYVPLCPPIGQHRYFFKVYALDILLDLPPSSCKTAIVQAMEGHVLDFAEMIGLYQRGRGVIR
ncbi:YbhB/YbcL family Raf kinase inhibitor-like protein [Candidatus Uhrbacteria bacterium]|nr:YbhB/YbcL family Raf kinase inhibitor-like protein [Candidatus Uhrbacteria bacterium]